MVNTLKIEFQGCLSHSSPKWSVYWFYFGVGPYQDDNSLKNKEKPSVVIFFSTFLCVWKKFFKLFNLFSWILDVYFCLNTGRLATLDHMTYTAVHHHGAILHSVGRRGKLRGKWFQMLFINNLLWRFIKTEFKLPVRNKRTVKWLELKLVLREIIKFHIFITRELKSPRIPCAALHESWMASFAERGHAYFICVIFLNWSPRAPNQ